MVIADWLSLSCRILKWCWTLLESSHGQIGDPPEVPLPSSLATSSTSRQKSCVRIGKILNFLSEKASNRAFYK
jgi:hypothetical protein